MVNAYQKYLNLYRAGIAAQQASAARLTVSESPNPDPASAETFWWVQGVLSAGGSYSEPSIREVSHYTRRIKLANKGQ